MAKPYMSSPNKMITLYAITAAGPGMGVDMAPSWVYLKTSTADMGIDSAVSLNFVLTVVVLHPTQRLLSNYSGSKDGSNSNPTAADATPSKLVRGSAFDSSSESQPVNSLRVGNNNIKKAKKKKEKQKKQPGCGCLTGQAAVCQGAAATSPGAGGSTSPPWQSLGGGLVPGCGVVGA
jgi:hypothetical protein